jgi:hypothetical protein
MSFVDIRQLEFRNPPIDRRQSQKTTGGAKMREIGTSWRHR